MQNANGNRPVDLPQNADNLKKQVIVQKAHRYGYDHAIFLTGARINEVVTMDEYKRACEKGDAVMTNFFNAAEEEEGIGGTAQIGAKIGCALRTSTTFPATSTPLQTCLPSPISGSTRAWASTTTPAI